MPPLIVAGTPIVPTQLVAIYFIVSVTLPVLLFRILHRQLIFTALAVQLFVLGGIFAVASYFLIPPPHVAKTNVGQTIEITFDHPVARSVLEKTIDPDIPGMWMFEDPLYATHLYRKVVFYPTVDPFKPQTTYTVTLSNISNVIKTSKQTSYTLSFTTPEPAAPALVAASQPKTVKLNVPIYLQQHALSCEVSALRMALGLFGITVSEEELLAKVGVDWTPHQGSTWGNPYEAFVGNVNGRQMHDGYGVYWGPIARVAREYRTADTFEGWTLSQVTKEIADGHPVIIWVYSSGGWQDAWNTPDGKRIYAVRDEHSVTVVGFAGEQSNPTHLIINDPLVGQVWWTNALFEKKWSIFGKSGVVVK